MKLENFHAVAELIKERDYLVGLLIRLGSETKITIKTSMQSNQDLRPDIVERMLPEMKLVIEQAIAVVGEKLAAFGVTTPDKDAA
ncbi:hypothetical protein GGD67_003867 [Bradyrhizobium sp. IAR9]|uniref:hypothetical protein n=1 Tax=Bradyrhizobium sp. IAR9 TaxID=2663841 RepID=UPI0015C9A815|nr:hypothetical protein [Bradyrhizobium sp. IAR9]NYG46396.1 hypothetical protein [Bradyrhizobium sp. IAR9]